MLDGSLDAAAAAIDAIPANEIEKHPQAEAPRGADGKFQAADKAPEVEAKAPEKVEQKADEPETEDDEPYVELPPEEEGKEPARHKLNDVIEGWRKAQTLEQELAKARETGPPPEAWETQIVETVKVRQQHMQAIEQWARVNQPQPPDVSLLNPQNPNYNPELYFQQHQQHQALLQANQQAKAQYEALAAKQKEEQDALADAYKAKEMAKLERIWPEYAKEKSVREKVAADLKAKYGLTDDVIASVTDHRFFALARDALAYQTQKATAQQVAKVVTAKPKLIPGKARPSVNGKAAGFNSAFGNLQKTGSIDAATAAIANLL